MNAKYGLLAVVMTLSMVLTLSAPTVSAQAVAPQLPGGLTVSQTYIDTLTYWYQQVYPQDWNARLTDALNPRPGVTKATAQSQAVVFNGVPGNAWWINVARQELNGSWTTIPSLRPAGAAPGPVRADLMIEGTLPGVYVLRACDQTGVVLANGPKLVVVAPGTTQTFDFSTLPAATAAQLANITM
jgi:hypothetical protein